MGEMILCERPIAANPYYIDELSLNIYSLEELCYYIFHNVYLMDAGFMSVALAKWIGEELSMEELSHRLLSLISDGAPLSIFVSQILSSCGYLTQPEIRDTVDTIEGFENKSDSECRKMRADRLMQQNKIVDAVYEYEDLLTAEENMTAALSGDIYHNLGCAYAKLFFFKEACGCFEKAYQRNHSKISLRSLLYACRCGRDEEKFYSLCEKYMVSSEAADKIAADVSRISQSEEIVSFDEALDRMHGDYDDHDAYLRRICSIVDQWKEDYNRLCRI